MGVIAHLMVFLSILPFAKDTIKEFPQIPLGIERGQYSGITWVAEDKYDSSDTYAVVDDKLNGGGIVFFYIPIDRKTGEVGTVTMSIAEGTASSDVKSKDNEGVAYFPSTGTLFVSAEGDQSIAEYNMNGRPTGVTLTIPEDLQKDKLRFKNGGFESLTYNANTCLFWTTPERHLKKDTLDTAVRLLQSFTDLTLTPLDRFTYRMDDPVSSPDSSSKYAFGIPDLCALDDGRIIVMEREVHVPKIKGKENMMELFAVASETFCKVKLYVVDPVHDKGEVLTKELIAEIETRSVAIANYEGICLGPQLADGSRILLLISDSQAHAVTTEWLKIFTIK